MSVGPIIKVVATTVAGMLAEEKAGEVMDKLADALKNKEEKNIKSKK